MSKRFYFNLTILAGALIPMASFAAQTCRSAAEIPSSTQSSRFTDNGDGTVTDNATSLMWAKCPLGLSGTDCAGAIGSYNWRQALTEANGNSLTGHNDWRLPNVKELYSIVEQQCYNPAINLTIFPNTPGSYFWSSSPYSGNSLGAWTVNFSNGYYYGSRNRTFTSYVRLVRTPSP